MRMTAVADVGNPMVSGGASEPAAAAYPPFFQRDWSRRSARRQGPRSVRAAIDVTVSSHHAPPIAGFECRRRVPKLQQSPQRKHTWLK